MKRNPNAYTPGKCKRPSQVFTSKTDRDIVGDLPLTRLCMTQEYQLWRRASEFSS